MTFPIYGKIKNGNQTTEHHFEALGIGDISMFKHTKDTHPNTPRLHHVGTFVEVGEASELLREIPWK